MNTGGQSRMREKWGGGPPRTGSEHGNAGLIIQCASKALLRQGKNVMDVWYHFRSTFPVAALLKIIGNILT